MAQITYRGNLSAKVFPFVSEYFGQSIIVPGADQNFSRQLSSSEDLDKDKGIPQIYYGHNIMPTADGFQSIGYTTAISDAKDGFTNRYTLRDVNGDEVFYAQNSEGNNYILPFGGSTWTQVNTISGTVGTLITTATVNGQSFIYFSGVGCYFYNAASGHLEPVTLTGLDTSVIIGITSAAGYMIAWSSNSIAWSSTVAHTIPSDPIDFVPSLITGAGGGNVEAAKGKITLCVTNYLGIIVYTTDNAVAALYSGNPRFPFNFREIVASGGLANQALVCSDVSNGNHYAYTTSGLQLISASSTQTIYPEITDFIAGKYFEDFDESTLEFVTTILTSPMKKALATVSDRYLVISYGVTSLTHALVFDVIQKRFGKLKIPHVEAFEFKTLGPEVTETPRNSLGFLQTSGTIQVVDFAYASRTSSGVMLLGKYQYVRNRLLQLDSVQFENVRVGNSFKLYSIPSLNGKTLGTPILGYLAVNSGNFRKYNFRTTAVNHSLLCLGNFYATSLELTFNIAGRR